MTGDLTSAFNFAAPPKNGKVSLPTVPTNGACSGPTPVTVPSGTSLPKQERGTREAPERAGQEKH